MPIYEYRCTKCGHGLEALQKMSDAPLVKCPACRKQTLEKLVSAASFRLKGGGWYETDFKTGDKKQLADSDSAGSASDSSSSKDGDKKAEKVKPETAKAEPKSTPAPEKKGSKSGKAAKAKSTSKG